MTTAPTDGPAPVDPLLTIDEAAGYLSIPKATLYTWRTRRVSFGPRAITFGGCLRFRRSDLADWIASHLEDVPAAVDDVGNRGQAAAWNSGQALTRARTGDEASSRQATARTRTMGRPPLPLGTWGAITTTKQRPGVYRALARYRDHDGRTRRITATATTAPAATRALRELMAARLATVGELVHSEMRLTELADLFGFLEDEVRIERSTINEYRRTLDSTVLPALGGLRIREATTGRLDRFIAGLKSQSSNRQRKAKVVLGAMLDMAVRHDAIEVNPVRSTHAAAPAQTRRPSPPDRGPRCPSCRDPVLGCEGAAGTQAQRRYGRHHRPDARHGLPHRRDPRPALGRHPPRHRQAHSHRRRHHQDREGSRYVPQTATPVRLERPHGGAAALRRRDSRAPQDRMPGQPERPGLRDPERNLAPGPVIERRWRQIRQDTGFDWVTPHTFRKSVATLVSEVVDSETAAQQLGHSSATITRDFYIAKPEVTADVSDVLQAFAAAPASVIQRPAEATE